MPQWTGDEGTLEQPFDRGEESGGEVAPDITEGALASGALLLGRDLAFAEAARDVRPGDCFQVGWSWCQVYVVARDPGCGSSCPWTRALIGPVLSLPGYGSNAEFAGVVFRDPNADRRPPIGWVPLDRIDKVTLIRPELAEPIRRAIDAIAEAVGG